MKILMDRLSIHLHIFPFRRSITTMDDSYVNYSKMYFVVLKYLLARSFMNELDIDVKNRTMSEKGM